jgi:hypothetical protein
MDEKIHENVRDGGACHQSDHGPAQRCPAAPAQRQHVLVQVIWRTEKIFRRTAERCAATAESEVEL